MGEKGTSLWFESGIMGGVFASPSHNQFDPDD